MREVASARIVLQRPDKIQEADRKVLRVPFGIVIPERQDAGRKTSEKSRM